MSAVCSVMTTAILAISLAPASAADAAANLKSAVDASRRGCPALRSEPMLDGVAQRANDETNAYIGHTARHIPFEDPLPILREMGGNAGKAKLLVGYGDTDLSRGAPLAKAIRGLVLQGWQAIPDCTYTRYGTNVLENAPAGYTLAAVVLAGL